MKTIEIINDKEVLQDVTCDICGVSCLISVYETESHLPDFKEFSYMSLSNHWNSKDKDWQTWSAQVCEECVDEHLDPLIVFKKTDDLSSNLAHSGIYGKGYDISDKGRQRKILREGRLKTLLNKDKKD